MSEPVERAGFAAEPRGDENAAGIDPGAARLAGMLRSTDPALRLAGVEEFAALAERGPVDSALLVASIEAAAAGPPRRNLGGVYAGALQRAWVAVARQTPAVAAMWYRKVLDTVAGFDLADPGQARLAVELVRWAVPAMLVGLGRTSPTMRELADIVAAAESGPPPAAPPAGGGVPFTDINLKLVVIEELMYSQSVLTPAFDMWEFAKAHEGREINIEREGYDVIPEALEYFTNLPLTPEALAQVTKLDFDGGLEVYGQVLPFWGGEDDTFDVHSFADVVHLPNLRRVALNGFAADDADLSPLHQRGIVVTD